MKMPRPPAGPRAAKLRVGGHMPAGPRVMRPPHLPQARPSGRIPMNAKGGKGSTEEHLPNRHALSTIVGGDPAMRSLGHYAKASPLTADGSAPGIMSYGNGTDL